TLTGTDTLANYQTALRSVTYQNTSLAPSELSRTVSFKVNDGDVDSAVLTATVNVTAVNSAPVNTIPATQVIKENNTLVFNTTNANVISIADDNSNSTVTLSVTNGILTLSQVTGLTFNSGSNGTASMQITGTLTDINAALNGMSYQPTTSFTGADTLTVLSDDGTLSSSD
ncbi:hypothetical protein, partial [Cysteiniphilum litorale]